jgi:hypothetical protein
MAFLFENIPVKEGRGSSPVHLVDCSVTSDDKRWYRWFCGIG